MSVLFVVARLRPGVTFAQPKPQARGAVVDRRRHRARARVADRPRRAGGRVAPFSAPHAIRLDGPTIAFTATAALVTTILSGLVPALRGARFNLAESLHGGDGASAGGFRGLRAGRLREALLVAESAFAVLLLVASGLLARSFIKLTQVDAGYTSEGVLAAEIYLPGGDADDRGPAMNALVHALVASARATAGIAAAGAGNMMPLDRATMIAGFPAPWTAPGSEPGTIRALRACPPRAGAGACADRAGRDGDTVGSRRRGGRAAAVCDHGIDDVRGAGAGAGVGEAVRGAVVRRVIGGGGSLASGRRWARHARASWRSSCREGLAVAGIGLAAGLAGAAPLTRLLQSVRFGVTPLDPASFLTGPIVLIPVALVACTIPALRAASTDPAEALRCE